MGAPVQEGVNCTSHTIGLSHYYSLANEFNDRLRNNPENGIWWENFLFEMFEGHGTPFREGVKQTKAKREWFIERVCLIL